MHVKQWRATAARALLAAGTAAVLFYFLSRRQLPLSGPVAPLPAVRPGAFLNAAPEATYVGLKSCVACHPQEHESYLATGHSRSLRDVDPASEPPGSEFLHAASGRIYEIYRRDHEIRHRESVRTREGEALVLADLPMRYAIGSGRFSRSYLASRNGFLVESPATWYAARPGWDISPGYERHNNGFERPIVSECINCHAGRAETAGSSIQRFEIHAQAIDCERCHGPGSLHVARWQHDRSEQARTGNGSPDPTIGNPLRLSRADGEAICAQCHLHSAATVELRGRRLSAFRPGQKLGDFCVHYGLQSPSHEMRVVGHVEQLRLSRCYLGSDSLTCITCHDPHDAPPAERTGDYFRGKCLSCHAVQDCGVPVAVRTGDGGGDNCITCHMPTAPTDIPHFAFTHHRIGVHRPEPSRNAAPMAGTLIPLDDISHLPQIDQDRCLGLAYLQCLSNSPENETTYRGRAQELLEQVRARGMLDPEVDAALARLDWRIDAHRTMEFAAAVLRHNQATPESRVTALFTLATTLMDQGRAEEAVAHLEELIQLRLYSEDWFLLSVCRLQGGDVPAALDAAQRAAEISPQFPQLQEHLADLYSQLGRGPEAAQARLRATQLRHSSLP